MFSNSKVTEKLTEKGNKFKLLCSAKLPDKNHQLTESKNTDKKCYFCVDHYGDSGPERGIMIRKRKWEQVLLMVCSVDWALSAAHPKLECQENCLFLPLLARAVES